MLPIFIISHDRYTVLRMLINRLTQLGQERIIIVDNASTYEPLLQYYSEIENQFEIIRMDKNWGPGVLAIFYDMLKNRYQLDKINFMYTDPDVIPVEECPKDFPEIFEEILKKYPVEKVGFSLKIDDLPDHYRFKYNVLCWESSLWRNKFYDDDLNLDLYKAPIDTTFSYRRANTVPGLCKAKACYRVGHPYMARHLTWYIDSRNPSEEDQYYADRTVGFSYYLANHMLQ